MPSIVGNIKIDAIGSSGVVNIGDSFYVSPKSTSKSFAGSGSFATGDFHFSNQQFSATNTNDSDLLDSDIAST